MGFWAHGSTLTVDSIPVGGITSLGLPEQSKEEVEITAHDSEGWREFVAGLRDGGRVALTMRVRATDPGQQHLFANFLSDNVNMECVIGVPEDPEVSDSAFTLTFDAFVLDTGGSLPFDDAGEITYTLRIKRLVTHSLVSV